jgi:hypothetical protein
MVSGRGGLRWRVRHPSVRPELVEGLRRRALGVFPTLALHGRAGPVTFCNRAKSNQKRLPLHPASSSGARTGRDASDGTRKLR